MKFNEILTAHFKQPLLILVFHNWLLEKTLGKLANLNMAVIIEEAIKSSYWVSEEAHGFDYGFKNTPLPQITTTNLPFLKKAVACGKVPKHKDIYYSLLWTMEARGQLTRRATTGG